MLHRLRLGLPVVAILFVGTAGAEVYQVDSEHSSVAFSIRHLVSRTSGNFHEFSGTINYDAGHPEKTQVEARIQAASIDTAREGEGVMAGSSASGRFKATASRQQGDERGAQDV